MTVLEQAEQARRAAGGLALLSGDKKDAILSAVAASLDAHRKEILSANAADMAKAKETGLSPALLKRLEVTAHKIDEMVAEVEGVRRLPDPVGRTLSSMELDSGLHLFQVSCPIGVIGAIFEARPDALVQIAALCIKSGNAVILKGGSEAAETNRALGGLIIHAADEMAKGAVQLISSREEVAALLTLDQHVDLLIPRGSSKFVRYIQEHSKIPVLGHSEGICHLYVDAEADIAMALPIAIDAKCQYPAVCNAIETLLVHASVAGKFLPLFAKEAASHGLELRGDERTRAVIDAKPATEMDWDTEYSALILSVKVVDSMDEALAHIAAHGSRHTEAIVTKDPAIARRFLEAVDASSVMWNASTRFADGFRYGKGAEVGISTGKLHARGPMGLEGLVIYKYLIEGHGQVVGDYAGPSAKAFTHRRSDRIW